MPGASANHSATKLLSLLKRDGFTPSDLALFDSAISSLSTSLARQTSTSAAFADFIVSKRRESYLGHASLLLSTAQKHDLLITPASDTTLFDQDLLEKVLTQVKEDSFISSSLSMAKIARSQASGKGKSSSSSRAASSSRAGSSGYSSPLDYPRSGSSSYGKRSTSPSRSDSSKRSRGGKSVSFAEIQTGFSEIGIVSLSSPDRRLFVPPLAGLEGQGRRSLGGEGSEGRVSSTVPFCSSPVLGTHPYAFVFPQSIKGMALEGVTLSLVEKGAVELAPLPSPVFYSRLFLVWKTSGSWRSVIDLSVLNLSLSKTPFKIETLASVLLLVRQGDWMVSLNLKEAYLQVPIHLDSRKFLRFLAFDRVYQFCALCFGLSTAPQVFTRVMAPVSSIFHGLSIRIWRYLDDWLNQASSKEEVLRSLETVLSLCLQLGIVVNLAKSNFVPAQRVQYLGTMLDSVSFRASPSQQRVEKLLSIREEFLSSRLQPASTWQVLLGVLSSLLFHLVPGRSPPHAVAPTDTPSLLGQSGRFHSGSLGRSLPSRHIVVVRPGCLQVGVSLAQVSPDLDFRSDASDVGWGFHLGEEVISGGHLPVDQCSGTVGSGAQAPALSPSPRRLHSHHLCRQFYSSSLPEALGGNFSQRDCSTDFPLGRVSPHCSDPSIHHGPE